MVGRLDCRFRSSAKVGVTRKIPSGEDGVVIADVEIPPGEDDGKGLHNLMNPFNNLPIY